MMTKPRRKTPSIAIKQQVLHEAGYRCANPACRSIITIDVHHLEYVAEGGANSPENLLALCPNCHGLCHRGNIPRESVRAWKMLLLSLNEAFPRRTTDLLLGLAKADELIVSGEGVLECAPLLASDLVYYVELGERIPNGIDAVCQAHEIRYLLRLTGKGRSVVEAWKRGDQKGVVTAKGASPDHETAA